MPILARPLIESDPLTFFSVPGVPPEVSRTAPAETGATARDETGRLDSSALPRLPFLALSAVAR